MTRIIPIATGYAPDDRQHGYPYDVGLIPDEPEQFVSLGEGVGYVSCGARFRLADLLEPIWDDHLRWCGCEWMREMAAREQASATKYTCQDVLAEAKRREPPPRRKGWWIFGARR